MNKNYLISIIIPIFNAETYLSETINSIIKQTIGFENIELILVDDKSTDNTRDIIEQYASEYKNIIPIYLEKNSGYPGVGRNKGIDSATSEYIMFIDSDDEYENDMCEQLYNTITKNDCDCVMCRYNTIDYLTNNLIESNKNEKIVMDCTTALYNFDSFVWNKIFKKSLIEENHLKFATDRVGEDTFFCIEYYAHSKSIILLNKYYGYKYFQRGESFSTTNLKWNLNVIKHLYETLDLLNDNNIKLNLSRFFGQFIIYSIYSTLKMVDNDWLSILEVLKNIYLFEKKIKFENQYLKSFLVRFINKFIVTNHLFTATLIIFVLNRIYNIKFILEIYRRIYEYKKI